MNFGKKMENPRQNQNKINKLWYPFLGQSSHSEGVITNWEIC